MKRWGRQFSPVEGGGEYSKISSFEGDDLVVTDFDERRVHYGKTDSVGGFFNNDESKGEEGKEAYLDGLL
jgi:hypothetical protein